MAAADTFYHTRDDLHRDCDYLRIANCSFKSQCFDWVELGGAVGWVVAEGDAD
jgi:hypothetical protein